MWTTFFRMVLAHYVCDFGLTTDWLALTKVPGKPNWFHALTAHCAIQAAGVYWATGSITWAIVEFSAHWAIDYAKGREWFGTRFGFSIDQALHIGCKLAWAVIPYLG